MQSIFSPDQALEKDYWANCGIVQLKWMLVRGPMKKAQLFEYSLKSCFHTTNKTCCVLYFDANLTLCEVYEHKLQMYFLITL